MSDNFCVFEYMYRDASNYKVHGALLLSGSFSDQDNKKIRASLESSEYFIAEQLDIPCLYQELWDISGGSTDEDHVLHEFVSLRVAKQSEINSMVCFGDLTAFISKFEAVSKWDYSLSSNYI